MYRNFRDSAMLHDITAESVEGCYDTPFSPINLIAPWEASYVSFHFGLTNSLSCPTGSPNTLLNCAPVVLTIQIECCLLGGNGFAEVSIVLMEMCMTITSIVSADVSQKADTGLCPSPRWTIITMGVLRSTMAIHTLWVDSICKSLTFDKSRILSLELRFQ